MKRRYHGSRVSKTNRPKHFAGLLALVLILVCTVGGTVAYLVTHTDPVVNTFTPGEVSCQVNEEFNEDNTVKTKAVVKNTGNVPAYIRVAVVANTIDEQGNITGMKTLPDNRLNETDWTKSGGFYYYKGVVQPGDVTANLLNADINLEGIQVTILASAIQSMPDDAVNEAWKMSYNSSTGNWTAVPDSH